MSRNMSREELKDFLHMLIDDVFSRNDDVGLNMDFGIDESPSPEGSDLFVRRQRNGTATLTIKINGGAQYNRIKTNE